jgi:hypothetical protein
MKKIISKDKVNGILKKSDFATIVSISMFLGKVGIFSIFTWWQVSQKLINVAVLIRHVPSWENFLKKYKKNSMPIREFRVHSQ